MGGACAGEEPIVRVPDCEALEGADTAAAEAPERPAGLSALMRTSRLGRTPGAPVHLPPEEPAVGADHDTLSARIAELEATCARQAARIDLLVASLESLEDRSGGLAERCDTASEKCESLRAALGIAETGLEEARCASEARLWSAVEAQASVLTGLVRRLHEEAGRGIERLELGKAQQTALLGALEEAARALEEREAGPHGPSGTSEDPAA